MKKTSLILIILLISVLSVGQYIPLTIKSTLYAISLTIQELLIFFIPFIIVIFIARSIILLKNQAIKLAIAFAVLIYISNFIASFTSFNVSFYMLNNNLDLTNFNSNKELLTDNLNPLWKFKLFQILSNKIALLIGVISGVLAPILKKNQANKIADYLFHYVMKSINLVFIPILPLFVLGFLIKLQHDKIFEFALVNHFHILKIIFTISLIYIVLIYFIASNFKFKTTLKSITTMLPASFIAFISMSSTAALPYTIEGVNKNISKKSNIIISLIPPISNMHLLGDCFLIPSCIMLVLKLFNYQISYTEFIYFLTYFVFMKFTVLTIPGGGIITILPLLSSELNFNYEMLSIIMTLYLLLDPFLAFLNVIGNGSFFIILSKIINKYKNN